MLRSMSDTEQPASKIRNGKRQLLRGERELVQAPDDVVIPPDLAAVPESEDASAMTETARRPAEQDDPDAGAPAVSSAESEPAPSASGGGYTFESSELSLWAQAQTGAASDASPAARSGATSDAGTAEPAAAGATTSLAPLAVLAVLGAAAAGGGGGGGAAAATTPAAPASDAVALAGVLADGYVANADLYVDMNDNGRIDAVDVKVGTTDAAGRFSLSLTSAQSTHALLGVGGTDVSTGLAFSGVLKAPAGSTVINPLTTLVQTLVESGAASTATAAETKVKAALGLTSIASSLSAYDPLAAVLSATSTAQQKTDALSAQAQAVAVANLMAEGASALIGASGTAASAANVQSASQAVLSALASTIAAASGTVSMTTSTTMQSVLSTAATNSGLAFSDASLKSTALAAAATTVATINQAIANTVSGATATTAVSALTDIVQNQIVAQSTMTTALASGNASTMQQASDAYDTTAEVVAAADGKSVTLPGQIVISSANTSTSGTPTISGTAAAGHAVTLSVGSATYALAAGSDGKWSVNLASATPTSGALSLNSSGANTVTASSDGTSATQTLYIDAVAPTLTSMHLASSNATAGQARSGDVLTLTFTASEELGTAPTVTIAGKAATVTQAADSTGKYTAYTAKVTLAGTETQGNAAISISGYKDVAGNAGTAVASTSDASAVNVDFTAPPTIASMALSADTAANGASNGDFVTRTAAQTISGSVSANLSSGEKVYVSLDNGTTWVAATATAGQKTWSLAGQTLTGSNTLKVKVVDAAGNESAVASQAYVLDATAPATTIATATLSADTGTSSSDLITKTAAQTVSGTLSANLASGETVYVSLDNGNTWTAATATVGQNTWSLAGQTLTGSNTLKVKVTDTAGNDGTAKSADYVLDTAAPAMPTVTRAAAYETAAVATGSAGAVSVLAESGQGVAVTFTNGSRTVTKTLTGSGAAQAAVLTSADLTTLTDGTISVSATVTDAAGNTSSAGATSFTLDSAAPAMTSAVLASSTSLVLTYSEALAGTLETADYTVKLSSGTTSVTAATIGTGANANQVTLTLGTAVPTGAYISSVTYSNANAADSTTDLAGNAAASQTVMRASSSLATGGVITTGAGNDTIVLVGTTAPGRYSDSSFTSQNGYDLKSLQMASPATVNGDQSTGTSHASEATGITKIDGGSGSDTLVVYGNVDLTGIDLTGIEKVIVNSDVTFSAAQINTLNANHATMIGDGASTVRVGSAASASSADLTGITMSNLGQLDIGDNVTTIASQTNINAIGAISSGAGTSASTSALKAAAGTSLSLSGKSVYGNAPVLEADGATKYAAIKSAAAGVPVDTIITTINTMLSAIDTSSGSFIVQTLGGGTTGTAAKNELLAQVVQSEYKLSLGHLDTTSNVLLGRDNILNFMMGGAGSDTIYGGSGATNFIGGGNNESTTTPPTNTLYGAGQRDFIAGGEGKDVIYGRAGNDFIAGNGGNDVMWGGDGTDLIDGNAGNDILIAEAGVAYMIGGTGDDKAVLTQTSSIHYLLDFKKGIDDAGNVVAGQQDKLVFDSTVFSQLAHNTTGTGTLDNPWGYTGTIFTGTTTAMATAVATVDTAATNARLWLNTDASQAGTLYYRDGASSVWGTVTGGTTWSQSSDVKAVMTLYDTSTLSTSDIAIGDATAPSVAVNTPTTNSITGTASDTGGSGIDRIDLFDQTTATTASATYSSGAGTWAYTSIAGHSYVATAYDLAGNSKSLSPVIGV